MNSCEEEGRDFRVLHVFTLPNHSGRKFAYSPSITDQKIQIPVHQIPVKYQYQKYGCKTVDCNSR